MRSISYGVQSKNNFVYTECFVYAAQQATCYCKWNTMVGIGFPVEFVVTMSIQISKIC